MNCLVLCSNPDLGLGVIRCLGAAGHRVEAMGIGSWPVYRLSRYCARYHAISGRISAPAHDLAKQINAHAGRCRAEVIVPTDLPAMLAVDALRPRLPAQLFPMSDAATLWRLHDKWTFAEFLTAHNLPHPITQLIHTPADLASVDVPPPWIIKPRDGDGGVGVMRVDDMDRLRNIVRADPKARVLQNFVPGRDVDVSFLADHGRIVAWTIQSNGRAPRQKVFHTEPRALELAAAIAAASGYHGVAHIDMRRDERDGTIGVLEFNPRFWNTLILSKHMGVNFPDLGLGLLRGDKIPSPFTGPAGSCRMFSVTPWRLLRAMVSSSPPADLEADAALVWRQLADDPWPEWYWRLNRYCPRRRRVAATPAPVRNSAQPCMETPLNSPLLPVPDHRRAV
jgi:hypothetical protein